jgi:RNA polymerase sigma-70 factor (ECF subfamily)
MNENDFIKSFDEYSDQIFRFCLSKTSKREVAEDLTQEAFMNTWQAVRKGLVIDNVRAYLYATARNLVIDYYRKKKTSSLDEMMEGGFDKEDSYATGAVSQTEVNFVVKEINNLEEKYREPTYLRLVEGMGPGEIAELLGENENTISVRINRGVKKVREALKY